MNTDGLAFNGYRSGWLGFGAGFLGLRRDIEAVQNITRSNTTRIYQYLHISVSRYIDMSINR
jgi:hypothetical protein